MPTSDSKNIKRLWKPFSREPRLNLTIKIGTNKFKKLTKKYTEDIMKPKKIPKNEPDTPWLTLKFK